MDYTTIEIKEKIINNKEITEEDKQKELSKTIISNDAYAIADLINNLIKKIEHLRVSALMR